MGGPVGLASTDPAQCLRQLKAFATLDLQATYGQSTADEVASALADIDLHIKLLADEKSTPARVNAINNAEAKRKELEALLKEKQAAEGRSFTLGRARLGGVTLGGPRQDRVARLDGDAGLDAGFVLGGDEPETTTRAAAEPVVAAKKVLQRSPLEAYLDADSSKVVKPEYFSSKEPDPGSEIENFLRLALGDAFLGPRIKNELRFLGADLEKPTTLLLLKAAMKDAELRRILCVIAREMLARKEAFELARIKGGTRAVDILFKGAGLHENTDQNYLRIFAPDIDTITAEATEEVAPTFAQGAKAVSLNSSSKKPDRNNYRQRLGEGDLNLIPGALVQVHEFDNSANPDQESIAQALLISRAFGKPILFGRRVVDVQDNPDAARDGYAHIATLSDGTKIRARYVVDFGLGKERIPNIAGLKAAYGKARERAAKEPTKAPGLLTYGELFRFIRASLNPSNPYSPYLPFSGKRVAVIGPGDSGKAAVRWVLRTNVVNPLSYGRDSTDVPGPKRIPWFGQTSATCDLFFAENRSFYADITKGYRNNTIFARGKLVSVEELADGTYKLTDSEGETEIVDQIILTTGFESQIPELYAFLLGSRLVKDAAPAIPYQEDPNVFTNVMGFEPTLGTDGTPVQVIVARQLLREDGSVTGIILSGPSAGRIVSAAELKEIEENFVANANHNWRVWRTIEAVVKDIEAGRARGLRRQPAPQPAEKALLALAKGKEMPLATLATKPLAQAPGSEIGDLTLLASRLFRLISGYQLDGLSRFDVVISRTEAGILVRFEPALSKALTESLTAAFAADPLIALMIEAKIGGTQRNRTVRFEYFFEDGRLAASSTVEFDKNVDAEMLRILAERDAVKGTQPAPAMLANDLDKIRERAERNASTRYGDTPPYESYDGYARMAEEVFAGDMAKTYDALKQAGLTATLKIPGRFTGTLAQFRKAVANFRRNENTRYGDTPPYAGEDGYARMAEEVFGGDMGVTHDALAQLNYLVALGTPGRFTGRVEKYRKILANSRRDANTRYGDTRPYSGYDGYAKMAEEVYDGDMGQTHDALAQMNLIATLEIPGRFSGKAADFRKILAKYRTNENTRYGETRPYDSYAGYARMAEEVYEGDMARTYEALEQMAFLKALANPGRFDGTAKQYRAVLQRFETNERTRYGEVRPYDAQDGYARLADEVFGGDMLAAFDAAFQMNYTKELGWRRRYEGTTATFKKAWAAYQSFDRKRWGETSPYEGQSGYAKVARDIYDNDLAVAFDRMEEIVGEAGVKELGWKRVPERVGPKPVPTLVKAAGDDKAARAAAEALTRLRGSLFVGGDVKRPLFKDIEGQLKYAEKEYKGDVPGAYAAVSGKLSADEMAALGWSADLTVSAKLARDVAAELPGTGFFSRNGFKSKYCGSGLLKVSQTYFGNDTALTIKTVRVLFGDEGIRGLGW